MVGASGTVTGVTGLDASEGALSPTALVATTYTFTVVATNAVGESSDRGDEGYAIHSRRQSVRT